jgi:phage shock protein C
MVICLIGERDLTQENKLYLDKDNKKIMGVCSGIASFYSIDVTIVRVIAFILLFFTMPLTLLIYFLLSVVLQDKPVRTSNYVDETGMNERLDILQKKILEIQVSLVNLENAITSEEFIIKMKMEAL